MILAEPAETVSAFAPLLAPSTVEENETAPLVLPVVMMLALPLNTKGALIATDLPAPALPVLLAPPTALMLPLRLTDVAVKEILPASPPV